MTATNPTPPPTLTQKYQAAWSEYQRDWVYIDAILAGAFASNSAATFQALHTKVVLVDGIYRTQLDRYFGRGAARKVANALLGNWNALGGLIGSMAAHQALTPPSIADALLAHREILVTLRPLGGGAPRSFASKFLHFHSPQVPIYDSRAAEHIGALIRLAEFPASVIWPQVVTPTGGDRTYTSYVASFVALYEHLQTLGMSDPVTVKGVDHLLWR